MIPENMGEAFMINLMVDDAFKTVNLQTNHHKSSLNRKVYSSEFSDLSVSVHYSRERPMLQPLAPLSVSTQCQ